MILFIAGAATALEVGETGLNHLRIQPDARIGGMGGASLGLAGNHQTLFSNPAGLSDEGMVLAANYLPYPGGIHIGSVLFRPRSSSGFKYSVGAFYINSGQMTRTSPTNEDLGTFSYHVVNLGGTAGYDITEDIGVGANLKVGLASADTNLQAAVGVDVGVLYTNLLPGLGIGLAVQHAAFEIKPFIEERSAIPVTAGGGVSYAGLKNLTIALDVSKPLDAALLVRGGIEFLPVDILALRLGYSSAGNAWKTGSGADILAGFSAGLGVRELAGVSIDYAVTPALDLGFFHRISLTYAF